MQCMGTCRSPAYLPLCRPSCLFSASCRLHLPLSMSLFLRLLSFHRVLGDLFQHLLPLIASRTQNKARSRLFFSLRRFILTHAHHLSLVSFTFSAKKKKSLLHHQFSYIKCFDCCNTKPQAEAIMALLI